MNKVVTSYPVSDIIGVKYTYSRFGYTTEKNIFSEHIKLPFIAVFGPHQDDWLNYLEDNLPKNWKIIFKSRKAVNNREHHGNPRQRNTLIVVDKCDE